MKQQQLEDENRRLKQDLVLANRKAQTYRDQLLAISSNIQNMLRPIDGKPG